MAKILLLPGEEANQDVLPVARMLGALLEEKKSPKLNAFSEAFVAALDRGNVDYYSLLMLFAEEYPLLASSSLLHAAHALLLTLPYLF